MQNTKSLKRLIAIASAPLFIALATSAGAAQVQTDDQIDAQYDAAMKHCDGMSGNDKDVCEKEAKAQRDAAQADAKAGKKSAEARHDATEEKRDANYKVAKEKCDAMSGDAKDQCIADAKTKYGK
ncbi:hypothetical protein [Pusillimonas noertemannii]|uniref:PsiF repeat-containing protein n=1 Tax=Pusillimonas noertemannii TaxID=305977 RepID=A0A2U1CSQ4_9BURK|nr:hypothetical protein [Pusillimonas noertemannii]NYT68153.1 hypothetical protein [Pusillimonas noertemannii]PVY68831.1 hypothetical protein C7440_1244 [Pusillimonas noertemannii]TFL11716.1 hypothetical protein CSC72_00865 [Pusillimonas noertemannii]